MSYIMLGLGWVLKLMYTITSNYGIAIILFTIIIKLILMPLTVKQQKINAENSEASAAFNGNPEEVRQ